MTRTIVAAIAVISSALAQDSRTRPQFEVASIKPNHSGESIMLFQPQPGGRFTASNSSLSLLVRYAYDVKPFQVSGAPDWVRSDRYDIAAQGDGNPGVPEIRAMLRQLLEDRFRLKYHWDTKIAAGYALLMSKAGKLRESEPGDCPSPLSALNSRPVDPPGTPCGDLRNSPGHTFGRNLTAAELADSLSFFVGRFVLDKTGLTGKYDIDLQWTPDSVRLQSSASPEVQDSTGPSIFTALQQQLGLRLETTKAPVKILVIEHVERPDQN